MAITQAAKEITELIYKSYGSYTGYLFGVFNPSCGTLLKLWYSVP